MRASGASVMRNHIRHAAIKTMHAAGWMKSARRSVAKSGGTLVLTLHRVIPDKHMGSCRSPKGMVLRESAFCHFLAYLKDHTTVVKPDSSPFAQASTEHPNVLLTFDDGWADNFSVAAPHLARFGMSACFFVVTGCAGASQPFWPEQILGLVRALRRTGRTSALQGIFDLLQVPEQPPFHFDGRNEEQLLNWLKQFKPEIIRSVIKEAERRLLAGIATDQPDPWERLMTWNELHAMAQAGHTIASHTATHALLTQISAADASSELGESSAQLRHHMGSEQVETQWIAYPNGSSDNHVRHLAHESGYKYGFTTAPGIWRTDCEPLSIPRINIWDGALLSPEGRFDERYLEYTLFWRALRAKTT